MLRYMNFLWATLFKRAFIYVINAVFAIVIIGLMYINKMAAESTDPTGAKIVRTFTSHPNSFVSFLAFIFAMIFMALVVIHVFKKQETEGTELMISAKPITRRNIVTGKMLIVLISLVGITLFSFLLFFIGAQFDSVASSTQKFKFAAGIAIGEVIVLLLYTSLILLLGTVLRKTGIMVVTILGPVGLFIFNVSAVPILGAMTPANDRLNSLVVAMDVNKNIDGKTTSSEVIYNDSRDGSIKDNVNSKYGTVKYFDLWGQWSQAFMILQPIDGFSFDTVGFYNTARLETSEPNKDNLTKMNVTNNPKGEDYYFFNHLSTTMEEYDGQVLPIEVYNAIAKVVRQNAQSITSTGFVSQDIEKFRDEVIKDPVVKKYYDEYTYKETLVESAVATEMYKKSGWNYGSYDLDKYGNKNYLLTEAEYFAPDNVAIKGTKPWLDPKVFSAIWALVAVGLISWAYFIYLRRDFK